MATQFTPCPACGAVGEIGTKCQFCGTSIVLKEGITPSDARIVPIRSISSQLYAERIAIYKEVKSCPNCPKVMEVRIGDETGLINLNAELIYPLQHEYDIAVISDTYMHLSNEKSAIYSQRGIKMTVGTLVNMKTMEKQTDIEYTQRNNALFFYAWDSMKCKGEIDVTTGEIIAPPSPQFRTELAMSRPEYKEFVRQKRAKEDAEFAEFKKSLLGRILNFFFGGY